jgi:hypothetical protein
MEITPIGPLAMLPLGRSAEPEFEPVPMARVERSARTQDETYSSSRKDSDSQPESQESGSEARSGEFFEEETFAEVQSTSAEPSTGAAPSFDLPQDQLLCMNVFSCDYAVRPPPVAGRWGVRTVVECGYGGESSLMSPSKR